MIKYTLTPGLKNSPIFSWLLRKIREEEKKTGLPFSETSPLFPEFSKFMLHSGNAFTVDGKIYYGKNSHVIT